MGQIMSALGEVNGTEEDLNLRRWEDLAGFEFPNPICKDPQNLVGFRVDAATEAKIEEPLVIADLAKVRMLELVHKQDELRSELIKLRDLYNIARKSYNAVREENRALQEYVKVVGGVQN